MKENEGQRSNDLEKKLSEKRRRDMGKLFLMMVVFPLSVLAVAYLLYENEKTDTAADKALSRMSDAIKIQGWSFGELKSARVFRVKVDWSYCAYNVKFPQALDCREALTKKIAELAKIFPKHRVWRYDNEFNANPFNDPADKSNTVLVIFQPKPAKENEHGQ